VIRSLLIISGKKWRVFLSSHAMNVKVGPKEDKELMTGLYTIADVYCCHCNKVYKEGKYMLEESKIVGENL